MRQAQMLRWGKMNVADWRGKELVVPVEGVVLSLCTQRRIAMQTERVGIREFRENLSGYLESTSPVAITRHGQTIGFFVPSQRPPDEADLEALRRAGERLQGLIASSGTSEDELVNEFKQLRKTRTARR
jgi:antitoxin (DNA-binding transcriptional repressor) of toxin-antitoxin stability system